MADVELDDVGGKEEAADVGEFVPLKKRKVKDSQLSPMIDCMPWFIPGIRTKMYKWYPGPTIMGHKMHWSEWLFTLFLITSVVFIVIGPGQIGAPIISICTAVVSFLACGFVWGFAKFKSLADVADRLERIAAETHAEVACYQDINDEWEEGLANSAANINQFTSQMGLVTDDANAIADLTDALAGLVTQQKLIQAEEKALHQISVKHQIVTRADIDEKQRANMKKSIERMFKRLATTDTDGDMAIKKKEDIQKLREQLQENEFLNQKKKDKEGNDTTEPLYNWLPAFEKIAADGVIELFEITDAIDESTDAYFLKIRDAIKIRKQLQEELDELKKEHGLS